MKLWRHFKTGKSSVGDSSSASLEKEVLYARKMFMTRVRVMKWYGAWLGSLPLTQSLWRPCWFSQKSQRDKKHTEHAVSRAMPSFWGYHPGIDMGVGSKIRRNLQLSWNHQSVFFYPMNGLVQKQAKRLAHSIHWFIITIPIKIAISKLENAHSFICCPTPALENWPHLERDLG